MSLLDEVDRVRAHSAGVANWRVDTAIRDRVAEYAGQDPADIALRIHELEHEWDMERVLEVNAAAIAGTGLVLGVLHDKRWLWVPGVVLGFLMQHALQGWCPPLPLFRRMGVRTRREIDVEKYALKALRGDFAGSMDAVEAEQAAR